MKMILWCSIAALLGLVLAKLLLGQAAVPFDMTQPVGAQAPSRIEIKGGVSGTWLVVNRANKTDPLGKGFDPSYTYLISDFKPVAKKLKDGKWQIQFVSEIAENLP
jgi:hypothetical protein